METAWHIPTACASCTLRTTSSCFVASALPAAEVDKLRRLHGFEQDRVLVRPGETSSLMGIVVEGVLRATHMTTDGRQEIVNLHERGSVFGHLFERSSRYGLETSTPALLCCFDRQDFARLVDADPKFTRGYLLGTLRELASAREHALFVAPPRAFERIARFILAHCDTRSPAPLIARMPVSRRDMAGLLGTTPETISRFVQTMVRGGVIRVRNARTLLVLDLFSLESAAGQSCHERSPRIPSTGRITERVIAHRVDLGLTPGLGAGRL